MKPRWLPCLLLALPYVMVAIWFLFMFYAWAGRGVAKTGTATVDPHTRELHVLEEERYYDEFGGWPFQFLRVYSRPSDKIEIDADNLQAATIATLLFSALTATVIIATMQYAHRVWRVHEGEPPRAPRT